MIKTEFLLLSTILKTRLYEVYPNIIIALWSMLNCADAFASTERSFSMLKLIKTFNRFYITNSRLSSLAMFSGDSRMKKVGGHREAKEKVGVQHKYLSCMVIFHCFEDLVAMIKPIKPHIAL